MIFIRQIPKGHNPGKRGCGATVIFCSHHLASLFILFLAVKSWIISVP